MKTPLKPHAFYSVFDKTGLESFAAVLYSEFSFDLVATGGTKNRLVEYGLPAKDVFDITAQGNVFDDLVKSLQWQIYAGIMAPRGPEADAVLAESGIPRIPIVVCNLYDLEQSKAKHGNDFWKVLHHGMDVGGPSMIAATIKRELSTAVVDPNDYDRVLEALRGNSGVMPLSLKLELSHKALKLLQAYYAQLGGYYASMIPELVA